MCSGPAQNQCLACQTGYLYVLHLGLCVEVCPEGYYAGVFYKLKESRHLSKLPCNYEYEQVKGGITIIQGKRVSIDVMS